MPLPEMIARISIPEKGKEGERPYEKFRALVLEGLDVYQNYTIMKGGTHYDEHGGIVHEETGHLEHIHAYDKEKQKTGRLLASIRREKRFGETLYVMEIYDRKFADFVNERWGRVEFIVRRRMEEKPKEELLAKKH
jgi:hypothetical protein